jgi:polyhydroxyalkanoate synthesis regulator protein
MTPDVWIFKYPNRKLYNQTDSVYVTGALILEMIRSGKKVLVVEKTDKKSNDNSGIDVTGETLAKALLDESENRRYSQESMAVLEAIIRSGGYARLDKKLL